ncbi:hypothetical protein CRV24_006926 [Beauveria bassiana]|nr:hypothetical protein CRV24_006926 [Beauveria bassiana]
MPSFADNHSGFVLPNARFNPAAQTPSCSGLLTPPESPKSGYARQLPTPKSTQCPAPTYEHRNLPSSSSLASLEPEPQSAHHDLSRVSETIYTIIEQVIEQKLAEAMGPLRLNMKRMDSENLEFHEQNGALEKQNDHLGNQVRRLEDQVNAQLQTVQNISAATSSSLEVISALIRQVSFKKRMGSTTDTSLSDLRHMLCSITNSTTISSHNFALNLEARKGNTNRTKSRRSRDW